MSVEGGGYLKGRIRREDIISAAAVAYAEVGYRGSSLRDIAKRVGISHAGLLYHFATKEALLAAVLERRDAEDSRREHLMGPPGLAVLRGFMDLAAHNLRNRSIVDLYSRLAAEAISPEHPAHDYFRKHYHDARVLIAESFHAIDRSGQLRTGVDPQLAALTFIALMDGLQVQWLSSPVEVDMLASLRFYLQSLITVAMD